MQQARVMHFGLDNRKRLKGLEIHWPNGQVVSRSNIKPGRYHIKQGAKSDLMSQR